MLDASGSPQALDPPIEESSLTAWRSWGRWWPAAITAAVAVLIVLAGVGVLLTGR